MCRVSAWLLLYVYVLVVILDFVIVLFQSGAFRVVVDILDFVILFFQGDAFRVVVDTRICFG